MISLTSEESISFTIHEIFMWTQTWIFWSIININHILVPHHPLNVVLKKNQFGKIPLEGSIVINCVKISIFFSSVVFYHQSGKIVSDTNGFNVHAIRVQINSVDVDKRIYCCLKIIEREVRMCQSNWVDKFIAISMHDIFNFDLTRLDYVTINMPNMDFK